MKLRLETGAGVTNFSYFIINVCDVHAVEDIVIEVVHHYSS